MAVMMWCLPPASALTGLRLVGGLRSPGPTIPCGIGPYGTSSQGLDAPSLNGASGESCSDALHLASQCILDIFTNRREHILGALLTGVD